MVGLHQAQRSSRRLAGRHRFIIACMHMYMDCEFMDKLPGKGLFSLRYCLP